MGPVKITTTEHFHLLIAFAYIQSGIYTKLPMIFLTRNIEGKATPKKQGRKGVRRETVSQSQAPGEAAALFSW